MWICCDCAYEILTEKLKQSEKVENKEEPKLKVKEEKGIIEVAVNSTTGRQVIRTITRELTRGFLGVLKKLT